MHAIESKTRKAVGEIKENVHSPVIGIYYNGKRSRAPETLNTS